MFQARKKIWKSKVGLTLIELLVSMFIMGTMLAVVVYNHKNFTDNLEITNLAYSVALSIREAQIAGISVQVNPDEDFGSAFGVHFNIGNSLSFLGNDKAFLTFADLDDSEKYDSFDGSYPGFNCDNAECINITEIGRGNYISRICYKGDGGNVNCPPNIKGVDITFLRPKPDGIIRFRNSGGSIQSSYNDKEAIICLKSPEGRNKSIHVLQTGQISVRQEECIPQSGGGSGIGGGGPS